MNSPAKWSRSMQVTPSWSGDVYQGDGKSIADPSLLWPSLKIAVMCDMCPAGVMHPLASEVIKGCIPRGQRKPFPANCMSLMTVSGAKGSTVNFSQIACLLGQQVCVDSDIALNFSTTGSHNTRSF